MHQNKISSRHSDSTLPRPLPVNDNRERPLQIETAMGPITPTPATKPFIRRIWAPAVIAISLGLTVVWIILLGYGLFKLMELAL